MITTARVITGDEMMRQIREKDELTKKAKQDTEKRKEERDVKRQQKETENAEKQKKREERQREAERKRTEKEERQKVIQKKKEERRAFMETNRAKRNARSIYYCVICNLVDDDSESGNTCWLQCDMCDKWVHQMCAGISQVNQLDDIEFICPVCSEE